MLEPGLDLGEQRREAGDLGAEFVARRHKRPAEFIQRLSRQALALERRLNPVKQKTRRLEVGGIACGRGFGGSGDREQARRQQDRDDGPHPMLARELT